jgi:hypothetical protein
MMMSLNDDSFGRHDQIVTEKLNTDEKCVEMNPPTCSRL